MRHLRNLCRIVFGLTFILSGFFKLTDPVGSGLIVKEYFSFLHLGFLIPLSIPAGVVLALMEFTIGSAILSGLKFRVFTIAALCLTAFFTLLTLYLAIFNPIEDCGCFGEAIHLTNTQTFLKNCILLLLILFLFFQRDKVNVAGPSLLHWTLLGGYSLIGLLTGIRAYRNIPEIDFTAYCVGRDLVALAQENNAVYESRFIYEKDGKMKEFTLENIPDTTWTFVDSVTELVSGSTEMAQLDFELPVEEGKYLAISTYAPEKLSERQKERIERFRKKALAAGYMVHDLYADHKTLMTLNRSNGGAVYFDDGQIVAKWSNRQLDMVDPGSKLDEDSDVLIVKHHLRQQTFSIIIAILILLWTVISRMVCRRVSRYRKSLTRT